MEKQRNGFVTFWLWLGIIGSVIGIPMSVMAFQSLKNLGFLGMQLVMAGIDITPFSEAIGTHVLILQAVAIISGICMAVFYSKILKWQKSGFWGLVITAVITAIINIVMMYFVQQDYALVGLTYDTNSIIQSISTPISLLILWAILQIKKDGVSCWKQLE